MQSLQLYCHFWRYRLAEIDPDGLSGHQALALVDQQGVATAMATTQRLIAWKSDGWPAGWPCRRSTSRILHALWKQCRGGEPNRTDPEISRSFAKMRQAIKR